MGQLVEKFSIEDDAPLGECCPACGASFDGGPIPENIRHHYSPPYRWSRKIGLVDRDLDMTTRYQCPDCSHIWNAT